MNPNDPFGQLPPAFSTIAPRIDELYTFIFVLSMILGFGILFPMMWFVFRYHRSRGHKATPTKDHKGIEIAWTFLPLIPLAVLFVWGFRDYMYGVVAPENALRIRVRAEQWKWEFEHPGGIRENGVLRVPVHRPVLIVLSSKDVLHSFFIPEFRVKRDAVPGMYQSLWFEATQLGRRQIFCTEYCGTSHSRMLANVEVITAPQYEEFLRVGPTREMSCPECTTDAQWGERLYTQLACNTCHSLDGSPSPGPTWRGLVGRSEHLVGGETITVDENYIRESILTPQAKIVAGYQNVVMPTFAGSVTDLQIDALIEYMRTVR
jgi:cytochrome c oxidase subunit II